MNQEQKPLYEVPTLWWETKKAKRLFRGAFLLLGIVMIVVSVVFLLRINPARY